MRVCMRKPLDPKRILHEEGIYWISYDRTRDCYIVWESGVTHSVAKDYIGYSLGLDRAIEALKRRL